MEKKKNILKVLVVDDSPLMRFQIKEIVKEAGYEVIGEAINGKDAVEKNKELKPDVIFLDIVMPILTGSQALEQIMLDNSGVKVVMVTTVTSKDQVVECVQKGAIDYIIKPFEPSKIAQILNKINNL